jgi:hypothetical protein
VFILFLSVASAYAGHTNTGQWCQCGCVGCICAPHEEATLCLQSVGAVSDSGDSQSAPADTYTFDDWGPEALFLVALLALCVRVCRA